MKVKQPTRAATATTRLKLSTETLRKISSGDPPENVTADKTTNMVLSGCIPCSGGGHTERCI